MSLSHSSVWGRLEVIYPVELFIIWIHRTSLLAKILKVGVQILCGPKVHIAWRRRCHVPRGFWGHAPPENFEKLNIYIETQKACKALAFGSWFTSFSRVLPTSCVVYHPGKPIESVVYCLNRHCFVKLEVRKWPPKTGRRKSPISENWPSFGRLDGWTAAWLKACTEPKLSLETLISLIAFYCDKNWSPYFALLSWQAWDCYFLFFVVFLV